MAGSTLILLAFLAKEKAPKNTDWQGGNMSLWIPNVFFPYSYFRFFLFLQSYALPVFFGGVTLTDVNTVSNVKAIAVAYFLNVDEEWKEKAGDLWEKGFLKDLQEKAEIYAPDLKVRRNISSFLRGFSDFLSETIYLAMN